MAQQPHFGLQRTVAPASEPITLRQAKKHLRVDIDQDDEVILRMLRGCRFKVESDTGRAIMPQTWLMTLDRFPLLPNSQYSPGNPSIMAPIVNSVWPLDSSAWAILLPRSPLISVTSIQYVATNFQTVTMDPSGYFVDSVSEPPRVGPAPTGSFWPNSLWQPNAVTVIFQAGYSDPAQIPDTLIDATLLLLGHRYENREAVVAGSMSEMPLGYQGLIESAMVANVW